MASAARYSAAQRPMDCHTPSDLVIRRPLACPPSPGDEGRIGRQVLHFSWDGHAHDCRGRNPPILVGGGGWSRSVLLRGHRRWDSARTVGCTYLNPPALAAALVPV